MNLSWNISHFNQQSFPENQMLQMKMLNVILISSVLNRKYYTGLDIHNSLAPTSS